MEVGYLDLGTYAASIRPQSGSAEQTTRALEQVKPWGGDGALLGAFVQYRLGPMAFATASAGAYFPFKTSHKIDFGDAMEALEYASSGPALSLGCNSHCGQTPR